MEPPPLKVFKKPLEVTLSGLVDLGGLQAKVGLDELGDFSSLIQGGIINSVILFQRENRTLSGLTTHCPVWQFQTSTMLFSFFRLLLQPTMKLKIEKLVKNPLPRRYPR